MLEHRDGRRYYYDHLELREGGSGESPEAGVLQSPLQLSGGAISTGQTPGWLQSTAAPGFGGHIVMRGCDVSRRHAPTAHIDVR